jgi:hypothetical protein
MQANGVQIDNSPNILIITDSDQNQITVTQPIVNVIEVNNPGPQGKQGPPGPPISTGSFTGSFTGSANFTSLTASSVVITENINILGTASINTLVINQTQLNTGSNQLGSNVNDFQTLYGTVRIPTGSLTISGSTISTLGFTGSLSGTASYALQSLTASYALNAGTTINTGSFVTTSSFNNFTSSYSTGSFTGSFTGSLLGTSSYSNQSLSSSYALTASFALNAGTTINTGSFVTTSSFNSFTSSYNTGSFTGSFTGSVIGTSSYANQSLSSSYALTASIAVSASYSLTSSITQQVSTSISTQNIQHNVLFVDTSGPGYVQVDGGLRYNPNQDLLTTTSSYSNQALSSSYTLTASFVTLAQSASYIQNAISSSYALTASFALNGGGGSTNTGSLLTTASVNLNTITFTKGDGSTFPITVNTGSGGGGGGSFPFSGSAIITGSLVVTGSTISTLGFTGSLLGTASISTTESKTITFNLGSIPTPITTGSKINNIFYSPYSGSIKGFILTSNTGSTTTLNIWKRNNTLPTSSDTIIVSNKPQLINNQFTSSFNVSNWTSSFRPNDIFIINVETNTSASNLTLQLITETYK